MLTLGSGKYLGSLATTGGLTVDGTIYLGNNGGVISNLSAGYSMTLQSGNKNIFKSWSGVGVQQQWRLAIMMMVVM